MVMLMHGSNPQPEATLTLVLRPCVGAVFCGKLDNSVFSAQLMVQQAVCPSRHRVRCLVVQLAVRFGGGVRNLMWKWEWRYTRGCVRQSWVFADWRI